MRAARPSFSIAFRSFSIHDSHLGGCGFFVAYARETEEIAWQLCATRMQNERPAHSEDATEETGFEDHVISRRSLAGSRRIGCGWTQGCPVVAREHERGEIDLTRQLQEPLQGGGPRIERGGPRFDVRDVFETARERLQQLRLLS